MSAEQDIFRVRRNYNKWVANQTLEDYSLRFTAKSARKWSSGRVANTALGAISFLALEAIGGAITVNYGFTNSVLAIVIVSMLIFLAGVPICYHAARNGIDIDLLTRGAGFGYIGSTITSLIYATFTFIFFAIEAAIMAMALEITLNIPLNIGYFICAVLVIPLVTHGITQISRFQFWTQPIWIVMQIVPLVFIALNEWQSFQYWTEFEVHPKETNGHFNLLLFGAAASVVFSLVAQIGEQVDFLRFLPAQDKPDKKWFIALISAGPGWIFVGMLKILIGSFLACLAISHGYSITQATDPNHMYIVAFSYVSQSPSAVMLLVGIFVVLSQLKINVTNAYAGSIAWSNFFSRVTQNHPGRVVWLVFNVAIALLLMELEIYRVMEHILAVYGLIAIAWVGSLVADLVINKPLGLRPAEIEFKRAHLYDVNPVGVGSMLVASVIGICLHVGVLGESEFAQTCAALASFITLAITFIMAPLIAWLTKGQFYIARPNLILKTHPAHIKCCICEHTFEQEDMSFCPAYSGPICSLCCSLDARCHDSCKTNARFSEQMLNLLSIILPQSWVPKLNTRVGNFIGLLLFANVLIAGLLMFIYFQIVLETEVDRESLFNALWKASFILIIISAVVCWIFILINESRRIAMNESRQQTRLLKQEIAAHINTDNELQKAKEIAEAANQAKSRYLAGISHELRSPLNAVLGYAQLLEKKKIAPERVDQAVGVIRRSSEYLADLIEGLLDISKIEAGRLDLMVTEVHLPSLLNQIVNMFKPQAEAKSIDFVYKTQGRLPEFVRTDEKRLRQILINLLSNAVKFTQTGKVEFTVKYRNEIAHFIILDTGDGIDLADHERIFKPFERIKKPGGPFISGTGLGLTITRLLTEIMGGDISLTSKTGVGSTFKLSMMLSSISKPNSARISQQQIIGYQESAKLIMLVDDDPTHRGLIKETLSQLGFELVEAADGFECLRLLNDCKPDLFLLDVSMPGMSGFELSNQLRANKILTPIIIVSADARESRVEEIKERAYDDYLVKPIKINSLLDKICFQLKLTWVYQSEFQAEFPKQLPNEQVDKTTPTLPINLKIKTGNEIQINHPNIDNNSVNNHSHTEQTKINNRVEDEVEPLPKSTTLQTGLINPADKQELIRLSEIGYQKAFVNKLKKLEETQLIDPNLNQTLQTLSQGFQFKRITQLLRNH